MLNISIIEIIIFQSDHRKNNAASVYRAISLPDTKFILYLYFVNFYIINFMYQGIRLNKDKGESIVV